MRSIGNTGRLLVLAAGLAALCHAHSGYATGVSPYAPLNLAPEIERDLERVLILGGQPVLRRPIALGLVANALPKACVRDAPLCKRIGRYLRRVAGGGLTLASVEAAVTQQSAQPLPNLHGMASDSAWSVVVATLFQPSDYLLASLGAVLDGTHTTAGSLLSFGFDSAQLDVGYRSCQHFRGQVVPTGRRWPLSPAASILSREFTVNLIAAIGDHPPASDTI